MELPPKRGMATLGLRPPRALPKNISNHTRNTTQSPRISILNLIMSNSNNSPPVRARTTSVALPVPSLAVLSVVLLATRPTMASLEPSVVRLLVQLLKTPTRSTSTKVDRASLPMAAPTRSNTPSNHIRKDTHINNIPRKVPIRQVNSIH